MSYLDLRTSKLCSNKRPNKEDFRFLRYCPQRKRSYTRKPRRWQIAILGLCFTINQSMMNRWITVIPLCSSSRRYCRTKSLINISMKQWWSSLAKYYRTLSTRQISRNWKKRSIVFSDQMLLTSRKEYSLKSLEKRSSPNWWMHHQRKPMLKWLKDLSNVSASLSTQLFYITVF